MIDEEINAISAIAAALESLSSPEVKTRVFKYIFDRYGSTFTASSRQIDVIPNVVTPFHGSSPPIIDVNSGSSKVKLKKKSQKLPDKYVKGDSHALVNWVKDWTGYDKFQSEILDKRDNVLKFLFVLYAWDKSGGMGEGIRASYISDFYKEFKTPIQSSNLLRAINKEVGYVMQNPGGLYKLSRKGGQHISQVLGINI